MSPHTCCPLFLVCPVIERKKVRNTRVPAFVALPEMLRNSEHFIIFFGYATKLQGVSRVLENATKLHWVHTLGSATKLVKVYCAPESATKLQRFYQLLEVLWNFRGFVGDLNWTELRFPLSTWTEHNAIELVYCTRTVKRGWTLYSSFPSPESSINVNFSWNSFREIETIDVHFNRNIPFNDALYF